MNPTHLWRRLPAWLRTLGLILWAAIVANGIVAVFGLYWGVL